MTVNATTSSTIDVRAINPRDRHALIFGRFDALAPGQSLQLVNDHDPRPLRYQFDSRSPGQFEWTYLQAGPDVWRVQIARRADSTLAALASAGSCCSGGACGG